MSKTNWLVVVTDHVSSYLYGPFTYEKEAKQWAIDQVGFHGRTIHVIPNRVEEPYIEEDRDCE